MSIWFYLWKAWLTILWFCLFYGFMTFPIKMEDEKYEAFLGGSQAFFAFTAGLALAVGLLFLIVLFVPLPKKRVKKH